jgi:16S rRNA (guanine(1405)-N(7))-methyltransferase
MNDPDALESIVSAVCENPKYARIDRGLIHRLSEKELLKGRSHKETVKAVRNKLHQVGGSYQEKPIDYAKWIERLSLLPHNLDHPLVRQYCQEMMREHSSTQERLPALDHFYTDTMMDIAPIHSLLDLACGLNPLSLPWLPLAPGVQITACDIYMDMTGFLELFFNHFDIDAQVYSCDLIHAIPQHRVQLALLLKTIPCLEQIDKSIGNRLLEQIQADVLLVSFPIHSLGGRSKGMLQFYENHFHELASDKPWRITRYEFTSELVFRLDRF